MKRLLTLKNILVLISFASMIVLLGGAYFCPHPFWQTVLINSSTSFMALGVALIFVNIYLERRARRGAVQSLLVLSNRAFAQFNNTFLNQCWSKFGKDDWGKIQQEFMHSKGEPKALRHDVRDFLYDMAKSNKEVKSKLDKLLDTLTELSRMVGWDLDARLLELCLDTRISIESLKDLTYDDSENVKNLATKHLMDAHLQSRLTRSHLMQIADVSDND